MHPFDKPTRDEKGARKLVVLNSGKGRAVTCDLCFSLSEPRCVYACPHSAARRVAPQDFFASR
jgi:Fe-S-cluster-containing hydrogenase component 2